MLSSILQQIDRLCTKGSPGCHVYCVHKILYRCFFELSGANTNIPSFQGVSGARGHKDVYGLQWTHRLCKSASIPTRRRPPPLYRCILIQAHSTSIVHSRFHEMSFPRVATTCFVILLVHRMQAAVAGAPCVQCYMPCSRLLPHGTYGKCTSVKAKLSQLVFCARDEQQSSNATGHFPYTHWSRQ